MNPRDVEHIAHLARIALTDAERDRMATELSAVLDYVKTLDALGLEKEAPLSSVLEHAAGPRADEPHAESCLPREAALAAAPEADGAHFLVPPVVDTR